MAKPTGSMRLAWAHAPLGFFRVGRRVRDLVMTLTRREVTDAMRTAIHAMLADLETGDPVVGERGGMMEFVMRVPPENGRIFGAAYLFVSEDEPTLLELQQRLSRYVALGLPETEES